MTIAIKRRIIDAMYRHALSALPSECCGVVIGKKGVADSFEMCFPCRNIQNEMRAKDPAQFPRTSESAYFLNPNDLLQVNKMAESHAMELKMIYHSHTNGEAYFSEEDQKIAIGEGQPVYPNVLYLVVGVSKTTSPQGKLFGWSAERRNFVETAWEII